MDNLGSHRNETERDRVAGSCVRQDGGQLHLVHHATFGVYDVDQMAPFSHFGTLAAASSRISSLARLRGEEDSARLISAFLDMRSPLMLPDINDNHSPEHLAELIRATRPDVIGEDLLKEIFDLDPGTAEEYLKEVLRDAGFDGLCYRNLHEDPGSLSWIILDPVQVIPYRDGPLKDWRSPWSLPAETFIGPAIVSDVFSIDGRDEDYEHLIEALLLDGPGLPIMARDDEGWTARWLMDWEPEATMGLFDPDGRPRGFYMGAQVWIMDKSRGHGRSALMINAAADLLGGSPTRNTSGMGFSPAGYAAHLSAWRRICEWAEENGYEVGEDAPLDELREGPD